MTAEACPVVADGADEAVAVATASAEVVAAASTGTVAVVTIAAAAAAAITAVVVAMTEQTEAVVAAAMVAEAVEGAAGATPQAKAAAGQVGGSRLVEEAVMATAVARGETGLVDSAAITVAMAAPMGLLLRGVPQHSHGTSAIRARCPPFHPSLLCG